MSAAILDHKRNPIGISGTRGSTRAGVGRKYRDCKPRRLLCTTVPS